MRRVLATAFATASITLFAAQAFADPIVGNWRTQSGETAAISKCGSSFCIKLSTGTYAGKRIGKLSGGNGDYKGTITDPEDDREYSGSAKVNGNGMRLRGCALGIFCQTQNWIKI